MQQITKALKCCIKIKAKNHVIKFIEKVQKTENKFLDPPQVKRNIIGNKNGVERKNNNWNLKRIKICEKVYWICKKCKETSEFCGIFCSSAKWKFVCAIIDNDKVTMVRCKANDPSPLTIITTTTTIKRTTKAAATTIKISIKTLQKTRAIVRAYNINL